MDRATKRSTGSLPSLFVSLVAVVSILATPSTSSTETFVFGGCSQLKFTPGSPYESSVNSMLTSLVNSAMSTTYNKFTIPAGSGIGIGSGSGAGAPTLYGLFQCRGDLGNDACSRCVARAVSQLGTLCLGSCGGALQLEGCLVKYDNATFLGVEDKTVVVKKCGPSVGYDSDGLTRRDAVLDYLGANSGSGNGLYRVGGSGNVQGMAQCVGDLSPSECQDCLSDAIQRLKTECGANSWGDVYLAKCYARFSEGGYHSRGQKDVDDDNNDEEIEKTLAILIGLIAGVALIIVFLSFLRKLCESGKGGK